MSVLNASSFIPSAGTKILVIGEKSSQVKKFAQTLVNDPQVDKLAGRIWIYSGISKSWKNVHMIFFPLQGHISQITHAKGFGWTECSPIELVQNKSALKIEYRSPYPRVLKNLAKKVDLIFIATDPDDEGSNIGMEGLNLVLAGSNKLIKADVRRVWNSSLTTTEIQRSFKNSLPWDDNLALSVQGRRFADVWLGFSGTREVTLSARKIHPIRVLSLGRVQLPTLNLIAKRDEEHESFKPEKRWKVIADTQTTNGEFLQLQYTKNPIIIEKDVKKLLELLKESKTAKITDLIQKKGIRLPPIPLNTTGAISLLCRMLKVTSKQALVILAELYQDSFLSYPRTDNQRFTEGFPHQEIIQQLCIEPKMGSLIKKIKSVTQVRVNGRKKGVEDHDPIHPTGEIPPLNYKHYSSWKLLTKYYIGLFMDDLVLSRTSIMAEIAGEKFVAKGVVILNLGWTEAISWMKSSEKELPIVRVNDLLSVKKIAADEFFTRPPPRWKDNTLLKTMENNRIGTKSSRPAILEKLIARGYVSRNHNQLVSEPLGRIMIQLLAPIWPDVITPKFTRSVETKMDEVAKKAVPYAQMLNTLQKEYINLHNMLQSQIPNLLNLISEIELPPETLMPPRGSFKSMDRQGGKKATNSGTKAEKCPICNEGVQLRRINSKTGEVFYGCSRFPRCRWTGSRVTKSGVIESVDKSVKDSSAKQLEDNQMSAVNENEEICPICRKGKLQLKMNRSTKLRFWGCSRFPKCRYTRNV